MNAPSSIRGLDTLVDAARAGQAGAMDQLAREALPFVQTVARQLASNRADAEEIAQDTLVAMLRNLDGFSGRSSFRSWLFAIVRSQVGRKYRRKRPTPASACGTAWREPYLRHDDARAWEIRADLRRAFASLSDLDRTIVLGRDLNGESAQAIAHELGLSVAALKSRLHRARTQVRSCLDRELAA